MIERLRRWRMEQKLRRGRCGTCDKILRDDETTGFCSDSCNDEFLHATSY